MAEVTPEKVKKEPLKTIGGEEISIVDAGFAILRIICVIGILLWVFLWKDATGNPRGIITLIVVFISYSSIMYVLIMLSKINVKKIYAIVLVADLIFIFYLMKFTGGMTSNFYLAFYLLTTLHSFYYGFRFGILVAVASSLLYVFNEPGQFPEVINNWQEYAFKVAFLYMFAIFSGFLSEKAKKDRNRIENLNVELARKQESIERASAQVKETREQLMRSEKLASIGTLTAEIAHEVNNPLDGIQNCLQMIKSDTKNEEQTLRYLNLIENGVSRIDGIVNKLLGFTRWSHFSMEKLNLDKVVDNLIDFISYSFALKNIKVERNSYSGGLIVVADMNYLQQAFFNVILNAVDAMPEGGTLKIDTILKDNRAEITISDTGIGIPEENMSRIFSPFFTTKEGKGTGLGLAISRQILLECGGEIRVASEAGKGATFTVTLPLAT